MTRDEAEKLVGKYTTEVLKTYETGRGDVGPAYYELLTALTTDTEMYEGEPKEEWRKTEEKIEVIISDIKRDVDLSERVERHIREAIAKNLGGKP